MKNKKEEIMKEEKIMVDIQKLVRLRNLTLTAIDISKEDIKKYPEGTPNHSYKLGILHCLVDYKDKLNALIDMG